LASSSEVQFELGICIESSFIPFFFSFCCIEQVGAGTMNPLTYLRVLGPEPWNVA